MSTSGYVPRARPAPKLGPGASLGPGEAGGEAQGARQAAPAGHARARLVHVSELVNLIVSSYI